MSEGRAGRSAIWLLFAIQLVSMGAMEMSGPFWPIHLRTLTDSGLLAGFGGIAVYVAPMLGIVLTSAFWGRLGDRLGHKLMMMRALLGLALTQLALAFAADVWTILALRFVQGACAGFIAPAQAYGVSIETPQRRARLFAFLQISTNLGSLAGAVTGGLILDHASFVPINLAAAALCALCMGAVAVLLPAAGTSPGTAAGLGAGRQPGGPAAPTASPPPVPAAAAAAAVPTAGSTVGEPPAVPSLWCQGPIPGLLLVAALLLLSRMLTQTPFSTYVRVVFGAPNWVAGLCYGLLALGFVVSASLWARYFERQDAGQALPRIAAVAAGCALLALAAGLTQHVVLFTGLHFVWGMLLGATTPVLLALVSRAAPSQEQGRVLGRAQSVTQFAQVAGIAIGGCLSYFAGLRNIYFFVALAYVLAALAVFPVLGVRARTPTDTRGLHV